MKKKRLIESLSFINEEYVKEAEPKMKSSIAISKRLLGRVACLALVVALSLYLFIPFGSRTPNLTAYEDSEYFPLIETIAAYRYTPPRYKNNFQRITKSILGLVGGLAKNDGADFDGAVNAPGDAGAANGATGESGGYVEVTDNQVEGVIESDIVKRTKTHLFRLSGQYLKVYTIDKENSDEIARYGVPSFADEYHSYDARWEMYLSSDGKTVTVIKNYSTKDYESKVGVMSIDVSDLDDIKLMGQVSIDGNYNSSRMVDGRLLLITEFTVRANEIDYDKPETYVPTITSSGNEECIRFEDIIYPSNLQNTRYSVVALMDEGSLDLLGANALLNFIDEIYVSGDNVYVSREYNDVVDINEESGAYYSMRKSDIAILNYSGEALEKRGVVTVEGSIKDQYSMDEYEGHFRVVSSTSDHGYSPEEEENALMLEIIGDKRESASLTIFNLADLTKVAEVKDFAPEGEEAVSVRFDRNEAYVCTAVIVTFTDPVYFFDLSDYSNITYTDTGVIEGFSTSLIQLGDGFLLGIGEENWEYGKVEVYEERNGEVVSVDKYLFNGIYSTIYKSYLIDRDKNLFGFAVSGLYDEEENVHRDSYVLLAFNGYELIEVAVVDMEISHNYNASYDIIDRVRAFIDDGYLYISTDADLIVVTTTK